MRSFLFLVSLFILSFSSALEFIGGDAFEKHREYVKSQDVVYLGPDPISLTTTLTITAEKVIIDTEILTNGFEFTITARWVEFTENSKIVAFKGPQAEIELKRQKVLAESRAAPETPGKNGGDGVQGFKGFSGMKVPGPIRIFAGVIVNPPQIDASGQEGSLGNQGQDGGDGQQGGQGKKAKRHSSGLWHERGPGPGAKGGAGGIGGQGGVGGDGGAPAPIDLHYGKYFTREAETKKLIPANPELKVEKEWTVIANPGKGGEGGKPGVNGNAGAGGPAGDGESSVWKGSGTGNVGPSGATRDDKGMIGQRGNDYDGSVVVQISNSLEGIMDGYLQSELTIESVNYTRELNALLSDLDRFLKDPNPEAKKEFQENIGSLRQRIDTLSFNYGWLLEDSSRNPQLADLKKLIAANQSALNSLREFSSASDSAKIDLRKLQNTRKETLKALEEGHAKAIESMKNICREIIRQKDKVFYQDAFLVSREAYKLFGPKELESWVFNEKPALTRDQLESLFPIETKIFGERQEYQIQITKEREENTPLIQGEPYVLP